VISIDTVTSVRVLERAMQREAPELMRLDQREKENGIPFLRQCLGYQ
jgi:hypothetical protein